MDLIFFYKLLAMAFACVGYRISTEEKKIFHFIRRAWEVDGKHNMVRWVFNAKSKFENIVYGWLISMGKPISVRLRRFSAVFFRDILNPIMSFLSKPLVLCCPCYASIWGSLGYVFLFPERSVFWWLLFIFSLTFLNATIYRLYLLTNPDK